MYMHMYMCVYIYIYILEAEGRYAPIPSIAGELLEGIPASAGSFFVASCFRDAGLSPADRAFGAQRVSGGRAGRRFAPLSDGAALRGGGRGEIRGHHECEGIADGL